MGSKEKPWKREGNKRSSIPAEEEDFVFAAPQKAYSEDKSFRKHAHAPARDYLATETDFRALAKDTSEEHVQSSDSNSSEGMYNESMNSETPPKIKSLAELGNLNLAKSAENGASTGEVSAIKLTFPDGPFALKSHPTKEDLLKDVLPKMEKTLKDTGLTQEQVKRAVDRIFETNDVQAIVKEVQSILRNVEITKNRTQNINQQPTVSAESVSNVQQKKEAPPVSRETPPTPIYREEVVVPSEVAQSAEQGSETAKETILSDEERAQLKQLRKEREKAQKNIKWRKRGANEDDRARVAYDLPVQDLPRNIDPNTPVDHRKWEKPHDSLAHEAEALSDSPQIQRLVQRLSWLKNDTQEKPAVKEYLIDKLQIRIDALRKDLAGAQEKVLTDAVTPLSENKKEGWWNKDFKIDGEKQELTPTQKEAERMNRQMDTIRNRTKTMREGLGLSHKDALAQVESFGDSRKNVRLIRAKLKRILKEGNFDAHAEEVQVLRDQLAKELRAFRKIGRNDDQVEPVSPLEVAVPNASVEAVSAGEKKEYEKRFDVREDWKKKKTTYENEYKKYLEVQSKKTWKEKIFFWKKENLPEALKQSHEAYTQSRKEYASLLKVTLDKRAAESAPKLVEDPTTPQTNVFKTERSIKESFGAGLANRFVLVAAREKIEIEKEYLSKKQKGIFESIGKMYSEHHSVVKKFGAVAVLATGGIFGAARLGLGALKNYFGTDPVLSQSILAKYTVGGLQALSSISAGTFGAVVGTYAGLKIADYRVANKSKRKASAFQNARASFSVERIDILENEYLASSSALEKAINDKKKIVAVSAVAGGIVAGVISGSLDSDYGQQKIEDAESVVPNKSPVDVIKDTKPDQQVDVTTPTISANQPDRVVGGPGVESGAHIPAPEPNEVPQNVKPEVQETSPKPGTQQLEVAEKFESENINSDSKVIPSPYTFDERQAMKEPFNIENFEHPKQLPDGSFREATPAEVSAGDYVQPYGAQIESASRAQDLEDIAPGEYVFTSGIGTNEFVDSIVKEFYEMNRGNVDAVGYNVSEAQYMSKAHDLLETMRTYKAENVGAVLDMGISSGDIDTIAPGEVVDMKPFFKLLKTQ